MFLTARLGLLRRHIGRRSAERIAALSTRRPTRSGGTAARRAFDCRGRRRAGAAACSHRTGRVGAIASRFTGSAGCSRRGGGARCASRAQSAGTIHHGSGAAGSAHRPRRLYPFSRTLVHRGWAICLGRGSGRGLLRRGMCRGSDNTGAQGSQHGVMNFLHGPSRKCWRTQSQACRFRHGLLLLGVDSLPLVAEVKRGDEKG